MYVGASALVLRCDLCNKPFDKPSTLKRHGYYCRSQRAGNSSRLRSCVACAKGKARCDNRRPICSRCLSKSTECQYPTTLRNSAVTKTAFPSLVAGFPSHHASPDGNNNGDIPLNVSISLPGPDVENLNWEDPAIDFSEFLNSPAVDLDVVHSFASPEDALAYHSTPSTNTTIYMPDITSSAALNFSIPPIPTDTRRSIILKSKPRPGSHRAVKLLLHTLKSYPQMLLRDGALPPYIHPYLVSSEFGSNDMESLTNCISLMHMISHRVDGSRKLFWKNVRLECERIIAEVTKFNPWELLAAIHALSIYMLLRVSEGETEHNNYDHLLLTTIRAISIRLGGQTYTPHDHICTPRACWLDWLYMESRCRLGVIFRVISLIMHFETTSDCSLQSDLVLAPLPSKNTLWEASDEFTWKAERDKQPVPRTAFALATNGELVRIAEMDLHGGSGTNEVKHDGTSEQNWEEWCSGMDALGGLVMLVASFLG